MFDTSTLTIVKSFSDGGALYFGEGAFDNWCVYKINANGTKQIPRDRDYFKEFVELCDKYDKDKLYADFLKIYDKTDKNVDNKLLDEISTLSQNYNEDALAIDYLLSTLYLAMIAEENKENTKLGRRIKRLGLHVLLYENYSVYNATNFMKKMNWYEIDALCKKRNF